MIRTIEGSLITEALEQMCIDVNTKLPKDVLVSLQKMKEAEPWQDAKDIIQIIQDNAEIARKKSVAMCQDTGMAVVFLEIGQDVHIVGGYLEDLVNEGIRRGYNKGFLRKSVVSDPLNRRNTGDNTPAIIHQRIVPGNKIHISLASKGFGSENMSRLVMLKPADGIEGVVKTIIETVEIAGPNPCPPIVVGVGLGGTFEHAAKLAKQALLRPLGKEHDDPFYRELEKRLLDEVNALGIGPQGFGGRTTALGVHIKNYATHIAGLPVAINIGCHASRHIERVI
jgi:fumarate hydratase subunit alpha